MDIDFKKLEHYIKILSSNYSLKLDDLTTKPEIEKYYNVVNNMIKTNRDDIADLILRQYRPSEIFPETIGSFLFGCFQYNYGDVPPECSPLCSIGIQNEDILMIEKCRNQIHIQYLIEIPDDGSSRFVKLGHCISTQGYIFVNLDFVGFTSQEITYLRNAGLYKVQILVTKDSKHHTVIKMRDVDDLPIIKKEKSGEIFLSSDSSIGGGTSGDSELLMTDDNSVIYITLAIIIISMIVVAYNR